MKKILLASILILLVFATGVAAKSQASDEAAIRKVFSDLAEAWGKDDAKSMASHYAVDGDIINPTGRRANGREQIEKLFADEHATTFKGTHITFSEGTIHFVTPNVAVFTSNFEIPSAHGPNGEMTLSGIVTSVLVKKQGKWWNSCTRPMVPVTPPRSVK